jgi:hypothetical protein
MEVSSTRLGRIIPPSVSTDWPVMFLAFGLTRKLTRFAISSGSWTSQKWPNLEQDELLRTECRFKAVRAFTELLKASSVVTPVCSETFCAILSHICRVCQDQCHGPGSVAHVCRNRSWAICCKVFYQFTCSIVSLLRRPCSPLTWRFFSIVT